jgi:hypothetical protein
MDVRLVAALPRDSLTQLHLTWWPTDEIDSRALSAALAQLSNLQQLQLDCDEEAYQLPGSCLSSVAQLNRLTSFVMSGYWFAFEQPLQQLLLQPLPLQQLEVVLNGRCNGNAPLPVLDFTQQTQLREFAATLQLPGDTVLPQQLQRLQLRSCNAAHIKAASQLTQLQQLTMSVTGLQNEQLNPLLCLAQLPALQQLQLEYSSAGDAVPTSPAWPQLTQLHELSLDFEYGAWPPVMDSMPFLEGMDSMLGAVAACSCLTKLQFCACVMGDEPLPAAAEGLAECSALWDLQRDHLLGQQGAVQAPICRKLAGIVSLQDLTITWAHCLVPGDAEELTALTGLTRLVLEDAREAVGTAAAEALAHSLRQLRELNLAWCDVDLGDLPCMATIGRLQQLTQLQLAGNEGLTQDALMLLTGLSKLEAFEITHRSNMDVDPEGWYMFWEQLRQHGQQQ